MVSTCGDSEYLADLDELVIGDGYMRIPEKGFQLALKVELDRERVARWAEDVVIGLEDAYGADLDRLIDMEWARGMKEESQGTKIKAATLIDIEEQALRAAEGEIRRFEKKDAVLARSQRQESISWQAEAQCCVNLMDQTPDDDPLTQMVILNYIEINFARQSSVIEVKQQSRVLENLLDLINNHKHRGSRREVRSAIIDLLRAWGPELSRDIWDIVLARSMKSGRTMMYHDSEFEKYLAPTSMKMDVYYLLA